VPLVEPRMDTDGHGWQGLADETTHKLAGLEARQITAQGKRSETSATLGQPSPQVFSLSSSNEERAGVRSRAQSTASTKSCKGETNRS
jgi:hypothetical protein